MVQALRIAACLPALMLAGCNDGDGDAKDRGEREQGKARTGAAQAGPPVKLRFAVTGHAGRGAASQTAEALKGRLEDLGVAGAQVRPSGSAEIEVRAPRGSERVVMQAAEPGRLRFYDFEPNVLGNRGPDDPFRGSAALYEAVLLASKAQPKAERTDVPPGAPKLEPSEADRRNNSGGERVYLFDRERRPLAGPARSRAALVPDGEEPAGSRVLEVPAGIVVVEAERSPNQPENVKSYYVLEDDTELSGSDIENPEHETDEQTQEPILTMEFTDEGREAFAAVTKRIAERGAEVTALLPPGTSEEQRQSQLQRFAIALDDAVVSIATIDNRENPEGVDGSTGAQINGIGSLEDTKRLALLLDSEPLPAELLRLP